MDVGELGKQGNGRSPDVCATSRTVVLGRVAIESSLVISGSQAPFRKISEATTECRGKYNVTSCQRPLPRAKV